MDRADTLAPMPTEIDSQRLTWAQGLVLQAGAHLDNEDAYSAIEAAAWLGGEIPSRSPTHICPVLTEVINTWNDELSDTYRTALLRPLIPRLVDTRATRAIEERRAWILADWMIREHTSIWLDLVGQREAASTLRALEEVRDPNSALRARPVLTRLLDQVELAAGARSHDKAVREATRAAEVALCRLGIAMAIGDTLNDPDLEDSLTLAGRIDTCASETVAASDRWLRAHIDGFHNAVLSVIERILTTV